MTEPVSSNLLEPETTLRAATSPSPTFDETPMSVRRQQAMAVLGRRALNPPEDSRFMEDSAAMIAEMLDVEHSAIAEVGPSGAEMVVSLRLSTGTSGQHRRVTQELTSDGRESLAGYVLELGRPAAVADWSQEDRFSDALLRGHGVRSALAVPLALEDRPFGALIAGSSRARPCSDDDLLFAENISYLVTATVARRKTEEALEEERGFSAGVLDTVGAMVLVLDPEGRILRVNPTCERVTGFFPSDMQGRPIGEVFPVSQEYDLFQIIFDKLRSGVSPVEYESSLVTKDANRRHIAWSYSAITAADGGLGQVIASGIDVTKQRAAEAQIKQWEQAGLADRAQDVSPGDIPGPRGSSIEVDGAERGDSTRAPIVIDDRRYCPRRAYPYRQAIGYVFDGRLPDKADFQRVECNDIAPSGFSFFSAGPPQSDTLVVALGNHPRLTYLSAQVIHATRVQRNGQTAFLIGCAYLGRVNY
jgi:PAS domain S-box-containing protein